MKFNLISSEQNDGWDGDPKTGPHYGWGDFVYFTEKTIHSVECETKEQAIKLFKSYMRKNKIFHRLKWKGTSSPTHYIREHKPEAQ